MTVHPLLIVSLLFVIFILISVYSYYSKRSPIVKLFLIIHLLVLIVYGDYLVRSHMKKESFRGGGGGGGSHGGGGGGGRSRSYGGSYGGGDWWSYSRPYGWNYGWPFYNSEECYYTSAGVIVCERPKPYFYTMY